MGRRVQVYAGGFQKPNSSRLGIGWVVVNGGNDREPKPKARRLSLKEANISIAQICAVGEALRSLKANRDVVIHSGSALVVDAIVTNAVGINAKREKNKSLRKAWGALLREIKRHSSVTAVCSEACEPNMALAIDSAQNGADLPFREAATGGKRLTPHRKTARQSVWDDELDGEHLTA